MFISENWSFILFWTYVIISLIILVVSTVMTVFQIRIDRKNGQEVLLKLVLLSQVNSSKIYKFRFYFAVFLNIITNSFSWPSLIVNSLLCSKYFIRLNSSTKLINEALQKIHPYELLQSIVIFLITLVVFCLSYVFSMYAYSIKFFMLITIFPFSWLLMYVISPIELVNKIRSSLLSPYLQFLIIALSMFFILFLSFFSFYYKNQITFENILELLNNILSFGIMKKTFQGYSFGLFDYYVATNGLLYYFVILRVIIRIKEFIRNDKDYLILAHSFSIIGKFNTANYWIEKVQKSDQNKLSMKAIIFLGLNKIDYALDYAKKSITLSSNINNDSLYIYLINISYLYLIPKNSYYHLLNLLIQKRKDEHIALVIMWLTDRYEFDEIVRESNLLEEIDYLPITYSLILYEKEMYIEAFKLIKNITPKTPFEEIVTQVLQFWYIVFNPQTSRNEERQFLNVWINNNLNSFTKLFDTLEDHIEKNISILYLSMVAKITEESLYDRYEEVYFTLNSIRKKLYESIETKDEKQFIESFFKNFDRIW